MPYTRFDNNSYVRDMPFKFKSTRSKVITLLDADTNTFNEFKNNSNLTIEFINNKELRIKSVKGYFFSDREIDELKVSLRNPQKDKIAFSGWNKSISVYTLCLSEITYLEYGIEKKYLNNENCVGRSFKNEIVLN